MSLNVRCPKCGGTNVQLVEEKEGHGCLWLILFGVFYVMWIALKWTIGLFILLLFDWWIAIIMRIFGKGYVWMSRYWFTTTRRRYYCHDCGHNFRT